MSDDQAALVSIPMPEEVRSETFHTIYSNASRVALSPWDLTLVFSTLGDGIAGESFRITSEVAVKMSPQQFKAFSHILPLIMEEWEGKFGEVAISQELKMNVTALHEALWPGKKAPAEPPAGNRARPGGAKKKGS